MTFQQKPYIFAVDGERNIIFTSELSARRHIEKHLFGEKEIDAWKIVYSYLNWREADFYLAETTVKQGFLLLKRLQSGDDATFQELYKLTALTIQEALKNAKRSELFQTKGNITVTYSTFGILTVIEKNETESILRTFFIPGFDVNYEIPTSGRGTSKSYSKKEKREQQKRERSFSPEEKLYYKVIRRGIHTIQHHYKQKQPTLNDGENMTNDYALLKPILKKIRSFKEWQGLLQ